MEKKNLIQIAAILAIVLMLFIKFGLPMLNGGGVSLPNLGASATGAMNSLSGSANNAVQGLQAQPEAQPQQVAPSAPAERKSLWGNSGGGQSTSNSQLAVQQSGRSAASALFGSACNADGTYDSATGLSCRQCRPYGLRWAEYNPETNVLTCPQR